MLARGVEIGLCVVILCHAVNKNGVQSLDVKKLVIEPDWNSGLLDAKPCKEAILNPGRCQHPICAVTVIGHSVFVYHIFPREIVNETFVVESPNHCWPVSMIEVHAQASVLQRVAASVYLWLS